MDELLTFAGNVGLALLLGTVIGVERQFRRHPAGLRTNALVAVGAALFVSLTYLLNDTVSPSRIASYIVSGVGFLGGGVILKEGATVRGITTAATLWCSAAVGTLAGAGFGGHAAVGTGVVLFAVVGLRPFARRVDAWQKAFGPRAAAYAIVLNALARDQAVVRTILTRHAGGYLGMAVTGVVVRKKKSRKRLLLRADLQAEPANDRAVQEIVSRLLIEPGVLSARWERLPPPAGE
jgi:putative Mg2+ transporter-C (MgtC) family protein